MNIKLDPHFKDCWIIGQDGNKIAQFFPCIIECCVDVSEIRGGEGHPIIYEVKNYDTIE